MQDPEVRWLRQSLMAFHAKIGCWLTCTCNTFVLSRHCDIFAEIVSINTKSTTTKHR